MLLEPEHHHRSILAASAVVVLIASTLAAQTVPSAPPRLDGTSWRLVQFQGGDVVKDGHLFLSLMADGGIYEFEPLRSK